jgi:hypothetical protein
MKSKVLSLAGVVQGHNGLDRMGTGPELCMQEGIENRYRWLGKTTTMRGDKKIGGKVMFCMIAMAEFRILKPRTEHSRYCRISRC